MQSNMTYHYVFVVRSILDTIHREVRRSWWRETGGALVGYVSDDGALVATHACGPGTKARRCLTSILVEGKYAQAFCDKMYRESDGRFDYVGDWHRHPAQSLRASALDEAAMRTIVASGSSPLSNPISLIYRRANEAFQVYTLGDDGHLHPTPSRIIDAIPS